VLGCSNLVYVVVVCGVSECVVFLGDDVVSIVIVIVYNDMFLVYVLYEFYL